jgi:hypothetical protein
MHFLHRFQGTVVLAIGVLFGLQVGLEDRFQNQQCGGLHHTIADCGHGHQ